MVLFVKVRQNSTQAFFLLEKIHTWCKDFQQLTRFLIKFENIDNLDIIGYPNQLKSSKRMTKSTWNRSEVVTTNSLSKVE